MDSVVNGLNALIDWFTGLPAWLLQLFKDLVSSLFSMLADLAAYVLDMLLQGVIGLIALVPIPATQFNANQYLAGAPAEFLGMLVAIRIPEALAIIVTALGIRFLLGLIPIVRVGG